MPLSLPRCLYTSSTLPNMNKEQEEKPICDEKELETIDDTPWYGVQLFGLKSKVLAEYLEETGVESFIPMHRVHP